MGIFVLSFGRPIYMVYFKYSIYYMVYYYMVYFKYSIYFWNKSLTNAYILYVTYTCRIHIIIILQQVVTFHKQIAA